MGLGISSPLGNTGKDWGAKFAKDQPSTRLKLVKVASKHLKVGQPKGFHRELDRA
ncbi:hypothetical protein NHP200010_04590 [Helicobacter bizzozeronii]|nr:hypothetical protein NHP200010_04590 [Helicobacter bizzozeronii]